MTYEVKEACSQVIAATTLFPERVREAAFRLKEFFGERQFGSIGRHDFAAYVGRCGERVPTRGFEVGGPLALAVYDLNILSTMAGFAGEIALWELIQTWIEECRVTEKAAKA